MDTCRGRFREETLSVTVSSDCFQLLGDKRSNLSTGRREGRGWGTKEKKEGRANLLGKCPRIIGQFQTHLIFEVINLNLG